MADVVILAAGRNERLKGVVPAHMKPLIVVNGRPLIVDLMSKAASYANRRIVVAAPQNVSAICEVLQHNGLLGRNAFVVVQPDAQGPTEALRLGMELVRDKSFVLLCGDNWVPAEGMANAFNLDWGRDKFAGNVCVQTMWPPSADRFTTIDEEGVWHPPAQHGAIASTTVWIGPVHVETDKLARATKSLPSSSRLDRFLNGAGKYRTWEGQCQDIGVPLVVEQTSFKVEPREEEAQA